MEIIFYVSYLIFHKAQEFFRELLINLLGAKDEGKVWVSRIIFKAKLEPNISKRQDFLTLAGEWMNLDVLDNPCWHLYCVEKSSAFFVLLPRPISNYSLTHFPFMYVPIYNEALALAEVQKEEFLQLAQLFSQRPQPKTVLFTNTARCGSTLLGKMLDRPGNSVCFGEPHSLCNLSIALSENTIPEEEIVDILKATVICLRAHVPVDQVCILKTTSREANLVRLTKGIPNLKHIFMFRRKALMSVERMFRSVEFSTHIFMGLDKFTPSFSRFISDCYLAGAWAHELKPENLRLHAAIIYASSYADYIENKDFYCLPVIWYHDLMENSSKTLKGLFTEIGIPLECVEEALDCLNEDSQKNSFLSWERVKHIGIPPVTDEDRATLKKYAKVMNIPEDTFGY